MFLKENLFQNNIYTVFPLKILIKKISTLTALKHLAASLANILGKYGLSFRMASNNSSSPSPWNGDWPID
jgi:hypothetical protein